MKNETTEIKVGQKWVSKFNLHSIHLSRNDIMSVVTVMDMIVEFKPLAGILSRSDVEPLIKSKAEFLNSYVLVDEVGRNK